MTEKYSSRDVGEYPDWGRLMCLDSVVFCFSVSKRLHNFYASEYFLSCKFSKLAQKRMLLLYCRRQTMCRYGFITVFSISVVETV